MNPNFVVKEEVLSDDEQTEPRTYKENEFLGRPVKVEPPEYGFMHNLQVTVNDKSSNSFNSSRKNRFVGYDMPSRRADNGNTRNFFNQHVKLEPPEHNYMRGAPVTIPGNFSRKDTFVAGDMPFRSNYDGNTMNFSNQQVKLEPREHNYMQGAPFAVSGNNSKNNTFVSRDMPFRSNHDARSMNSSNRQVKPEPPLDQFALGSPVTFFGNNSRKYDFVGRDTPSRSGNNGRSISSSNRQLKPEPPLNEFVQGSRIHHNISTNNKFGGHDMSFRRHNREETVNLCNLQITEKHPEHDSMQAFQIAVPGNSSKLNNNLGHDNGKSIISHHSQVKTEPRAHGFMKNFGETVPGNNSKRKKFVGHDSPSRFDNRGRKMNFYKQQRSQEAPEYDFMPYSRISATTSNQNENLTNDMLSRADKDGRTKNLCNRQNSQEPPRQGSMQNFQIAENERRNNKITKSKQHSLTVTYDSDDEFEAEFGVSSAPPVRKRPIIEKWPSFIATKRDPHQIFFDLDYAEIEVMLRSMLYYDGQQKCIEAVFAKNSLHEILTVTYLESLRTNLPVTIERYEAMEKVFRVALAYLPSTVLWNQDEEGNTLLHRAIHAGASNIVRFLVNMGSPLYVRNCANMTVVETCIVMYEHQLLDIILKNGGTFHHLFEYKPLPESDHYALHQEPSLRKALPLAENVYEMLKHACRTLIKSLIGHKLQLFDHEPIMSFQRGNLPNTQFERSIEFTVPENWVGLTTYEFMLVIMPVVYNEKMGRFDVRRRNPCVLEPIICGKHCPRMVKRDAGTIFYNATKAMKSYFKECKKRNLMRVAHESQPQLADHKHSNPRICTLTLSIPPQAQFSFLTCQIVVFTPRLNPLDRMPLPPTIQTKKGNFFKKGHHYGGVKRQNSYSYQPYTFNKKMKWY